jgi:hypothetical protein
MLLFVINAVVVKCTLFRPDTGDTVVRAWRTR